MASLDDMIPPKPYNVVVPKFKVEDIVKGGLSTLRKAFPDTDIDQDEYLIGLSAENEVDAREYCEMLLGLGFGYDDGLQMSDDFTVVTPSGVWWNVPWLIVGSDGMCWFIADVEAPADFL